MTGAAPPPVGTITQDHTKGRRLKGSQYEDAVAVCARAIAGDAAFALSFGTAEEVPAPSKGQATRRPPHMSDWARAALRGEADLAGLYRAHHKPAALPADPEERAVVEALERVRLETLGSADYPGLAANLSAALLERCVKPIFVTGTPAFLQAEALAILLRENIDPRLAPSRKLEFAESRRTALGAALSPFVSRFCKVLEDQAAFQNAALDLARSLPRLGFGMQESGGAETGDEPRGDSDPGPVQGDEISRGEAAGLKSATEETSGDAPLVGSPEKAQSSGGDADGATAPNDVDDPSPQSTRRTGGAEGGEPPPYRVFTRAFDRVTSAVSLLAEIGLPEQPTKTEAMAARRKEIARLAGHLRRALMAQRPQGWVRDQTDGSLDPARLARVVTDPGSGRFFRQPKDEPFNDTVLTLLIDNSSSMRGEPLQIVAEATELIAHAVESCGVRVEVLGFTTQNWRGGQARSAWVEAGRPHDPGRVSELLHIVYKQAGEPVRALRSGLRLIAARGLHKENVDGEALEWAYRRLLRRPERRKTIIMISDGAPSEETTLSLSHFQGNRLEAHLRQVIGEIERAGAAELFAIGIGYEVNRLYPQSVRIDEADGLAAALVETLPSLLSPSSRRRPLAA